MFNRIAVLSHVAKENIKKINFYVKGRRKKHLLFTDMSENHLTPPLSVLWTWS